MAHLWQDLRYAARTLARRPAFTVATVLTLGLGIGANVAIFSVVNSVLIQPLPYQRDAQLIRIQNIRAGAQGQGFSPEELQDLRARSEAFTDFVEYHSLNFVLLGRGEPQRVQSGVVSWRFFQMLGIEPAVGRLFSEEDDQADSDPVLLLSYRYWQSAFGGDSSVIGETVRMNDKVHTIVGVLPAFPHYPRDNDVYMPTVACPFRPNWIPIRQARGLSHVFGRLRESATPEQASADLDAVAHGFREDHPEAYPSQAGAHSLTPVGLKDQLTAGARPTLLILMGTVGLVLLIACANVANLMLAQLFHREREMALRTALGAGTGRLSQQLLTESLMLALAGGVVGLLVAVASLDLLVGFAERFTPRAREITVDGTALLFTALVACGTGIVFGLLPSLPSRRSPSSALRDAGRSATGSSSPIVRNALVVSQLALSFLLLIGAGLALRSFARLSAVDAGVDADNVLTVTLAAPFNSTLDAQKYTESLIEEIQTFPGVHAVALTQTFPLDQQAPFSNVVEIEGRLLADSTQRPSVDFRSVTPGYLETVGQMVLTGRAFRTTERGPETPKVVIVNQAFAERHFPDASPVGQRLRTVNFLTGTSFEIVGVVSDVRQQLDAAVRPEVYLNRLQVPATFHRLLVRTAGPPMTFLEPVREIVRRLAPDVPLEDVRTLAEVRRESIASPRLTAILLGAFASLALVISITGIAGVIGFSVSQRSNEIGIRMALGADRQSVLSMVLRQGMVMVGAGLALGLIGAIALNRTMTGLLFDIEPTDPMTYAGVALLLASAAAAATLVPARRAAALDPMQALRNE